MQQVTEIKAQKGFQEAFLSTPADIAIGGGAAGSGKTYALLLETIRNYQVKNFGSVIFRRTYPQIKAQGGMWDTSETLLPYTGAKASESTHSWKWKSGSRLKFSHLEYEKNVLDWQGSQIPLIGFDELTHFSDSMFFYLLSRNRSTTGIKPYVRATCNPDPESWVAEFIAWWIDQDTGFPIPERAGKLRYFMKESDNYIWGGSKDEIIEKAEHLIKPIKEAAPETNPYDLVKSVTFIPGSIYDNRELLLKDPGYLANLMAQDENTKARLLEGNWKIKIGGDELINFVKFKDSFTNEFVPKGQKCITADIALEGSDLFLIAVWDGWRLIDMAVHEKVKGPQVIELLKFMARKYEVPQSRIVYDDDGIGAFIDGFLENAIPFNGMRKAMRGERYKNLRSQCFFKLADKINTDGLYIAPGVADIRVRGKGKTIKAIMMHERRAIKRAKPDHDGKHEVIPKQEMKVITGGDSPDCMDVLSMRNLIDFIDTGLSSSQFSKSDLGLF